MVRMASRTGFMALLLASAALAPAADAAIVNISFAGTLSSAVNNSYSDPDIPQNDFYFVDQAFSGVVSYDDALPAEEINDDFAILPLLGFTLDIGGRDLTGRFFPRLIGRDADGRVEFVNGGADQGGGAMLSVEAGQFAGLYPSAARLNGRTASFSFQDAYPLGGVLSGRALIGSVPEPASWALMIGGFGLLGGAMRRRAATPARVRVTFG